MKISKIPSIRFFVQYAKTYKIKSSLIALAVVVLAGMAVQTMLQRVNVESAQERIPNVNLLRVDEYRIENAVVESIGEVESLSQVQLKSQLAERVREIRVGIGEYVNRGDIVLVLDSSSLDSQIDQAQANLTAEEIRLEELKRGARSEELQLQEVRVQNARIALTEAKKSFVNSVKDAYTKSDDGIRNKIDTFFTEPESQSPQVNFPVQDSQLEIDLEWERFLLEEMLNKWKGESSILSATSDLDRAGEHTKDNLEQVRSFLEKLAEAVNDVDPTLTLSQTTIDAWKANVSGVRTSINATITGFAGAEEKLQGAEAVLAVAENELALTEAGASTEQLTLQEARVRSAQAALQNLVSQRDRVSIPAPISGTIATLPIRVGELISGGQTVMSIVNPGSLQVKTYLNSKDVQFVEQGARAVIEETIEASVAKVAPSLDPEKKKVETLIAITDSGKERLVIGEFAHVKIFIGDKLQGGDEFFLPLESVKVTSEASFVYTLNDEYIVEQKQVRLGRVIGDSIEVLDGLERGMSIIFSVRGLEVGDKVEVQ